MQLSDLFSSLLAARLVAQPYLQAVSNVS